MDQKQKEQEVINNCDAVIWAAVRLENGEVDNLMNFFRSNNNIQPTDLGHKYNILTYKQGIEESIEVFSAIIGDPRNYVDRLCKAGYNGIMFKQNSCKRKEMKDIFRSSMINWGFSEKAAKAAIKQLG
jgi:hypothetical protein